ncbi:hypothetical protein XELAEV_18009099mg [Xenopus laevis]|uniref:VPS37 C-terminal domain-containing protein n=1 Tax=Xenopus laevis TaxID=8355 RepID=A0A974DU55_XENLA|nr:hypothetical protein XELAEV_18009099mg [Xenopus laevis]
MSWIFPSSKSPRPLQQLTSLQQQKQRQIESLKASHSSIAEIQKDVEYRLPFTVQNLTININILLPPQFPQEKPHISVFPPIHHHLVDKQGMNVIFPPVNNFTMHSDLGKIVQTLLEEFWKNPPTLAPSSGSFPYETGYFALVGINGFTYTMPDIPETFSELLELSVSQLSEMSDQEDLLLEQFVNLPQLKQVISDKEELVRNIEEMAKRNLQMEPILEFKRQAILDKYEQLMQLKSSFEKKLQRQHELSESCSLSALQARLKVRAHESEEESDKIADEFLEGKIEIDEFLVNFMEKRTCCHSRKAKEEKLQQVISLHSQYQAP